MRAVGAQYTSARANRPKAPAAPKGGLSGVSLSKILTADLWSAGDKLWKGDWLRLPFDTWLLLIILALAGLGSVVLFSASFARAELYHGDPFFYFSIHMRNLAVGLALMAVLSRVPYQIVLRLSPLAAGLVVLLLIAVLHPGLSKSSLGSGRWLRHVPFQPSEAAKVAAVLLLSDYFVRIGELKNRFWYGFAAPCLVIVLFGGLIVLEKDLGGALVVFGVVVSLMVASGVRPRHLVCFLAFAPAIWFLIGYYKHRVSRILGWDNPWLYPTKEGYSVINSFYAFANGGLSGAAIGQGQQQHFFLPMAHTDYILSILGEERGFFGVSATCLLVFLLAVRYFQVIHQVYLRLRMAMRATGYKLGIGPSALRGASNLVGSLLVRSFDRAERVGKAMACRGYSGVVHVRGAFSASAPDLALAAAMLLLSAAVGGLEWRSI